MKVGDQFTVDQKDYRKCLFEVVKVSGDGGVVAHDVNEPKKPLSTPVKYCFNKIPLDAMAKLGQIKWLEKEAV